MPITHPHSLSAAYNDFLSAYPDFKYTQKIDALRAEEYTRLDEQGHVYLDYTGGGLYADSQLRTHTDLLRHNVFGNPHSMNPTSLAATQKVEQARKYVYEFFNASPEEYVVIFTPNASGALKLVGESYPFGPDGHYLLAFDNHNSVNGIREFARAHASPVTYIPLTLPDMRVDEAQLGAYFDQTGSANNNLFAFPAQSNFSGVQHPLEWIEQAQAQGWDVLLDTAAFVPTNRLDLSRWKPDFAPVSFYKMFGYPTGVGCLLAKKEALNKLRRPWFAGGTITVASVQGDKFYMAEGEAAFEDGTLNYLSLPAVETGLRHLNDIGIQTIHQRVTCLTGWLLDNLTELRHSNGEAVIRVYGPTNTQQRGGTIALNFYDPQGRYFSHHVIEEEAASINISLRGGCFCNPGGGEIALELSKPELAACFNQPQERLTFDDFQLCIDDKSTGAVRISVGLVSNFADVYKVVEFARGFVDRKAVKNE
ncbi:MAG TPA: aminotransferase class V-fold PLP-dependent enzyme [Chloroflexi bacterium]|nr:aminotransferase class V-fold PLP-dependent enzyme [Chloroflexota bacterium]